MLESKKHGRPVAVAVSAALLGAALVASSQAKETAQQPVAGEKAAVGEQAYVYGYPLLVVDATKEDLFKGVTNHFVYMPGPPPPDDKSVVRPNADTLYTTAMLDLSSQPVVVHVPESRDRYYVVEMMDAYTSVFASPGTRTSGAGPHDYLLVGPRWSQPLQPTAGMTVLHAPTSEVWIIARTQLNGPGDIPAVNAIQRQFAISTWSDWPKGAVAATPVPELPRGGKTPPERVRALDAPTFFNRLALLMRDNPPSPPDAALLERFLGIGLVPGHPFNPSPNLSLTLQKAEDRAYASIDEKAKDLGEVVNGWHVVRKGIGTYGTDYLQRAAVTEFGLGANLPDDAIYPSASADAGGQPLDGHKPYRLHFDNGQLPPVNAFWSLTMYDKDGYFVPNALHRYAARDSLLKKNPDGSVDIYVQADSPGKDCEANWLPAPKDAPFTVLLRMYWPKESVLHGAWEPPGLVVSEGANPN